MIYVHPIATWWQILQYRALDNNDVLYFYFTMIAQCGVPGYGLSEAHRNRRWTQSVSRHDFWLFNPLCVMICVSTYAHTYTCTCRRPFYEKRMSTEMAADFLGDEWRVCAVYIIDDMWGREREGFWFLCGMQVYVWRVYVSVWIQMHWLEWNLKERVLIKFCQGRWIMSFSSLRQSWNIYKISEILYQYNSSIIPRWL